MNNLAFTSDNNATPTHENRDFTKRTKYTNTPHIHNRSTQHNTASLSTNNPQPPETNEMCRRSTRIAQKKNIKS